ncbi:hypothetical protein D7V86_26645 [bacterium D16-51]|nr:hypothetical protein D7V86_26645 [bacterium D16-51]
MLAEKSPYINSAYQHLQVISRDKEKRLEYEAREKAVRDHNQMMKEARERGMQEGRREGRRESIIEVAENFIKLGLGTAEISKGTGLSENEIEGLRKKMK